MSNPGGLLSDLPEEVIFSPAEPQTAGGIKPQTDSLKEKKEITDREEENLQEDESEDENEDEEEVTSSALLEPTTLPWPGDKDKRPQTDDDGGSGSEKRVSEPEERDTGISGGSQDLAESDRKHKSKWRESMPEGERWRDDEIEVRRDDKGDGSLADDEHEEEEEEEDDDTNWMSEKAAMGFTPQVTIVRPSSKEAPEETRLLMERDQKNEPQMETESVMQFQPEWTEEDDKYCK